MSKTKKQMKILFFTNNFGFGPTSRAHTIASHLKQRAPTLEVRLITDGRIDYLFEPNGVVIENVPDLRGLDTITSYLQKFDPADTLVVSVMNRFAITASHTLGINTILLDGLYWFWKKRPAEYSDADYEIRYVLPWMLSQYQGQQTKGIAFLASPVDIDKKDVKPRAHHNKKKDILMTVNGFISPFYEESQNVYLDIMSDMLNRIDDDTIHITLVGGEVIESLDVPRVTKRVLSKREYIANMMRADCILLNGGSNSFLEALVAGRSFIFTLPSNQSQYCLIDEVARFTNLPIESLCPLLNLMPHHRMLLKLEGEKEAIALITNDLVNSRSATNYITILDNACHLIKNAILSNNQNDNFGNLYNSAEYSWRSTEDTVTEILNSGLIP